MPPAVIPRKPAEPSMPAPATPSLLVVDDEPDLRTLYELTLLREGYDVETAGSVEDVSPRSDADFVNVVTRGGFGLSSNQTQNK